VAKVEKQKIFQNFFDRFEEKSLNNLSLPQA
jgi:hypothetical protein